MSNMVPEQSDNIDAFPRRCTVIPNDRDLIAYDPESESHGIP